MTMIGHESHLDERLMQHGDRAARCLTPQEIEKLAPTWRLRPGWGRRHSRTAPAPRKADG
jgi:hypothetical protein